MKKFTLEVTALSPLHLGAGKADVVIDAEVVHDEYGMPYFPAKRMKGLLYESALELAEISGEAWFSEDALKKLFGHGAEEAAGFSLENLYLPHYEELRAGWGYLNKNYAGLFRKQDVLASYTDIRFQTMLDKETGTAADGSLHNMRMVDAGTIFTGELELYVDTPENMRILELALKNLRFAGAKRNRGCGHIKCVLKEGR